MKTLILSLLALFSATNLWAQCNPYYDIKKGMEWEMTNYNAKGKVQGRNVSIVDDFDKTGNGWEAVMTMKMYDKKDKLTYEQDEVEMNCENGVISLNMERFIPEESMQAFKDMNMELEVDNLEVPDNLEVGMTLDDGGITISGDMPMTVTTTITNRKVEAKESITTPAGTFECYKISYEMAFKMVMNRNMKGVDWIAKDVGVVKTESYNGSGKLMGYSMLTKVK